MYRHEYCPIVQNTSSGRHLILLSVYRLLLNGGSRHTVRGIFVLPKLTLPDDKLLVVEVYEKGGARHQSFRIENTDLVAAKPISELHLK